MSDPRPITKAVDAIRAARAQLVDVLKQLAATQEQLAELDGRTGKTETNLPGDTPDPNPQILNPDKH